MTSRCRSLRTGVRITRSARSLRNAACRFAIASRVNGNAAMNMDVKQPLSNKWTHDEHRSLAALCCQTIADLSALSNTLTDPLIDYTNKTKCASTESAFISETEQDTWKTSHTFHFAACQQNSAYATAFADASARRNPLAASNKLNRIARRRATRNVCATCNKDMHRPTPVPNSTTNTRQRALRCAACTQRLARLKCCRCHRANLTAADFPPGYGNGVLTPCLQCIATDLTPAARTVAAAAATTTVKFE